MLLIALVIGVIAWQAWGAYEARTAHTEQFDESESSEIAQLLDQEAASDRHSPYQCDGRVYCSQIRSSRFPLTARFIRLLSTHRVLVST